MITFVQKIKDMLKNRFYLLIFFAVIFIVGTYLLTGNFLPTTDTKDLWFYSGLFMVLFSILFIEPYYTSPKNVITNTIPLLLVFLSIEANFEPKSIWHISFWSILVLLILSILPLGLNDENKSPEHWKNQVANFLKRVVVIIGKGKIIYSAVFLLFLFVNITSAPTEGFKSIFDSQFIFLMILWGLILSIYPKELNNTFSTKQKKVDKNAIGEIFGVQSKKIFLVKLFEDRKSIKKFDIVKFRYSMQDSKDLIMTGIVFDTYLLNQEKWTKILQLGEIREKNNHLEKNVVYKISEKEERNSTESELKVQEFVGIITNGSNIGKIKFEYSKKDDDLQEGDLLELEIGRKRLFYQVVNGFTEKEKLENKNEMGFIEGEAIQIGEWQNEKLSFQKFGWVPSINTPIFKANTENLTIQNFEYPNYKLGVIPNTSLPSVINLDDAVSHHMALLGITGSGKSFLARKIIKELNQDTKIIIVDFTGEWKDELNNLSINTIDISDGNIDDFLQNNSIGIVSMNATSNTSTLIEQTQKFLEKVFDYAKQKHLEGNKQRICLVLEEAHTITPETNFLGDFGDYSANKALVNKMGQIALQGRKYGVGLLMIAQRTANMSKTMLTQCNTVICFQAFDETSFNFLGNYVGKDLVQTLPNLKQYHAIVTGKAAKANIPMIIDLRRKDEEETT